VSAVGWYLRQVGIAFDMFMNALLGGVAGQTLSLRAALAARRRVWGWCVLCRFLSWWVQRDHCADQLNGVGMDEDEYFRAMVGLFALALILSAPGWILFR
jgi:hypothetical protein